MIAVIDTASRVRHACFNTLTKLGYPVVVFHSPDTFINSGTIYKATLLIIGKTRVPLAESEGLQWARSVRPSLRILVLGPREISLKQLHELFEREASENSQPDICDDLTKMRNAFERQMATFKLRELRHLYIPISMQAPSGPVMIASRYPHEEKSGVRDLRSCSDRDIPARPTHLHTVRDGSPPAGLGTEPPNSVPFLPRPIGEDRRGIVVRNKKFHFRLTWSQPYQVITTVRNTSAKSIGEAP
jgi:hypothetical protein